jgi:hypothetical protein
MTRRVLALSERRESEEGSRIGFGPPDTNVDGVADFIDLSHERVGRVFIDELLRASEKSSPVDA